ncbi:hypothetical protein L1887_58635 [Cichorium endivia]|nr:hypothetical protein L1887_58635 [Cichorium endivia]
MGWQSDDPHDGIDGRASMSCCLGRASGVRGLAYLPQRHGAFVGSAGHYSRRVPVRANMCGCVDSGGCYRLMSGRSEGDALRRCSCDDCRVANDEREGEASDEERSKCGSKQASKQASKEG